MKRKEQRENRTNPKKHRSYRRTSNSRHAAPRTVKQYFAKSERFQAQWNRVTHVISKMRPDGASLRQASRELGLSSPTVTRRGRPALRKRSNGQHTAQASDRLLRALMVPRPD